MNTILFILLPCMFNTLRPRQNGRLFEDDTFKRIFLDENIRMSIKISLKFVRKGLINNIPALVLIMAWRRPGDKPLSEPMLVRSLTHICVTRPQWVKLINTASIEINNLWLLLHGYQFSLYWRQKPWQVCQKLSFRIIFTYYAKVFQIKLRER